MSEYRSVTVKVKFCFFGVVGVWCVEKIADGVGGGLPTPYRAQASGWHVLMMWVNYGLRACLQVSQLVMFRFCFPQLSSTC